MLINLKQNNFNIEVNLPLSKSESNRALMIAFYLKTQRLIDSESQRLCDFATLRLCVFITLQLSDSDDTVLLKNLLWRIQLRRIFAGKGKLILRPSFPACAFE